MHNCKRILSVWPICIIPRLLREASADDLARWAQHGTAGSASYAVSGRSFGPRKGRKRASAEESHIVKRARSALTESGNSEEVHEQSSQVVRSSGTDNAGALAQYCRWADWTTDLQKHRTAEKDKQAQQDEVAHAVATWVFARSGSRGDVAMGYEATAGDNQDRQEASSLPVADQIFPTLEWVEWCPPASHIASAALGGNRRKVGRKLHLRKQLLDQWKSMHEGVRKDRCVAPAIPKEGTELCYIVGQCMCDEEGQASSTLVSELCKLLGPRTRKGWLKKKTVGRRHYDNSRLVLRLSLDADKLDDEDIWLTLFYGNLNSMVFFSLQLQLLYVMDTAGSVVLRLPRASRPQALWIHLRGVHGPLHAELWRLADTGDSVTRFAPGLQIHVHKIRPTIAANIGGDLPPHDDDGRRRRFRLVPWNPGDGDSRADRPDAGDGGAGHDGEARGDGEGGQGDELSGGQVVDGALGDDEATPDGEGGQGDGPSGPGDADPHGTGFVDPNDPGDAGKSDGEGDQVGGALGRRMALLDKELVEIEENDLWSSAESGGDGADSDDGGFGPALDPVLVAPVPTGGEDDGGFGPALDPDPAPVEPVGGGAPDSDPPAARELGEEDAEAAPRPARRRKRRHHDGPWNNVDTDVWGKFVLDETGSNTSIGCHCPYHGAACRINKVAWKRPVGWMTAWVLLGHTCTDIPDGPAGMQKHMSMRFDVEPGQLLDEVERASARLAALRDPQMARVFQWEQEASREEVPDTTEPRDITF